MLLLFSKVHWGQKQCGACVCELEHVPPSDLESSWQHHQTFMREMERLWRTVWTQGYRKRGRDRECELPKVNTFYLSALTLSCCCFYGPFGCARWVEVNCNRVSVTSDASVWSSLQQLLGLTYLRDTGLFCNTAQQLVACCYTFIRGCRATQLSVDGEIRP